MSNDQNAQGATAIEHETRAKYGASGNKNKDELLAQAMQEIIDIRVENEELQRKYTTSLIVTLVLFNHFT